MRSFNEYNWHNLGVEKISGILKTDLEKGLTEKEAERRRKKFGENKIPEKESLSRVKIFFNQLKSPLIYILIIAGIITLGLKEYTDTIVIFAAVILNSIVGYIQEYKAVNALRALKKVIKHTAEVIREGRPKIINAESIVPGDIFLLKPGDKVPCDGRVVESFDLKTNESALTGEWLPSRKTAQTLPPDIPLADRDNMVYMGTIVESGKAKVIATATGKDTEIGKIAQTLSEAKESKTPLQKKLSRLSKIIGFVLVFVSILILVIGLAEGYNFLDMFTLAVAVAVAAVPEGLPVAITAILTLGMERILRNKGLVRKLLAAETLGSTSLIATDKTGTLTEGKMRVVKVLPFKELLAQKKQRNLSKKIDGEHEFLLKIAALCNEAFVENPEDPLKKWVFHGRPTDKALLTASIEAGINKFEIEKGLRKVKEFPFNSKRKYIAVFYQEKDGRFVLYIAGAPEKLLELSNLKDKEINLMGERLDALAEKGLRLVGLGYKEFDKKTVARSKNWESLIKEINFAGIIGLQDPIRKEVKGAIELCKKAGIKIIIVTGDHKLTAKAVGEELGFRVGRSNIIEGKELEEMADDEFQKRITEIDIYSRVEPLHKMKIIREWQRRGEIVAMTGDGINDAPALRQADIGVALGSGTDVAKETSDLVLLNNSFNIIVKAVEEGRVILDNIKKIIAYLLSDSFTEVTLIAASLIFGWPLPVLAGQILWVNVIEDGPLALSLVFEKKEKDIMRKRLLKRRHSLLEGETKALIAAIGIFTNLLILLLLFFLLKFSFYEIKHLRTVIFAALTVSSMFYIFSCKSLRKNIWETDIFNNKFMVLTWLMGAIMLVGAIYLPFLQKLLKTVPLTSFDWKLVIVMGLTNIVLIEAVKRHYIEKKLAV
jgi:Ca2+-transporting ATPase